MYLGIYGASTDEMTVMRIENGEPVVARFRGQDGKVSSMVFLEGASVMSLGGSPIWFQIWFQPCLFLPQIAYRNRPEVAETNEFSRLTVDQQVEGSIPSALTIFSEGAILQCCNCRCRNCLQS